MPSLKEKFAHLLSIPPEIALDLPTITITGRQHVIIENYKNILEFSDTHIAIRTKDGNVTITGQALRLKEITAEDLIISGRIENIALP